jgi:hypothetical protein
MILFFDGKRFVETRYDRESEFEAEVVRSHKTFFGPKAIYVNAKQKIDTKALGGSIPDGFLFNLADVDNPEFYLVEIELASHDFYRHIFPQLTKFFGFFKNAKSQSALVEKLYDAISADNGLKNEFKKLLGEKDLHKFLRDVAVESRNILLILDDTKAEMDEVIDIYADTWGEMVKSMVLRRFVSGDESIFTTEPEFEGIEFAIAKLDDEGSEGAPISSEEHHLEGVNDSVRHTLSRIKEIVREIAPTAVFNPQKYYISIKYRRNVAYLQTRKSKIRMVAMLLEDKVRSLVRSYSLTPLSPGVQKFYGRPCTAINVVDANHLDEIRAVLQALIADTDADMGADEDEKAGTN